MYLSVVNVSFINWSTQPQTYCHRLSQTHFKTLWFIFSCPIDGNLIQPHIKSNCPFIVLSRMALEFLFCSLNVPVDLSSTYGAGYTERQEAASTAAPEEAGQANLLTVT